MKQDRTWILYFATNDRIPEAMAAARAAGHVGAMFRNPKYFHGKGDIEPRVRVVRILEGSPKAELVAETYRAAKDSKTQEPLRVDVEIIPRTGAVAASPAPSPGSEVAVSEASPVGVDAKPEPAAPTSATKGGKR